MDLAGEAIKEMRVRTNSAGNVTTNEVWKMQENAGANPSAFFVIRGSLQVNLGQETALRLEAGDLLVFIRSPEKHLTLEPEKKADQISTEISFLFAVIEAEIASDCPLCSAIPDFLVFRSGERVDSPHIEAQLQCLVWESQTNQPASVVMQERLWEIVFMQSFRLHLSKINPTKGWIAAIKHPELSKVLVAIHSLPEENWTVEALAKEAAMSRATLARRFREVLDTTPLEYLYQLRMRLAASLLLESNLNLGTIAEQVGYGSDSAFSTAFYRRFKMYPSDFRHREILKEARNS